MNVKNELLKLQDKEYREFTIKINPSINPKYVIGVRTPDERALAKRLYKEADYKTFLNDLPHKYFDENNVHAFVIEQIKDFGECIEEINKFLPYVDNWATCDQLCAKVLGKNKKELLKHINIWLKSKHTYTIRFAVEMLMSFFLDEDFDPKQLKMVAKIKSKEYYVNMMRAWYFATALAKKRDETMKIIESNNLDTWTHNKTIRKAIESFRISEADKKYLRTLKRNEE